LARGMRIVAYCGWISGGFGFWIRGLFNPLGVESGWYRSDTWSI
jgi:hypothetical protein